MKYRVQIQQIFGVTDGSDPYAAEWLDADVKPRSLVAAHEAMAAQANKYKNGAPVRIVKLIEGCDPIVVDTLVVGTPFFVVDPVQVAATAERQMCADSAWFLYRVAPLYFGCKQSDMYCKLRSFTIERILNDAEDVQEQACRAADKFRDLYVGRVE